MDTYDGEEPNAIAALSYDAARLLAHAVNLADLFTPEGIWRHYQPFKTSRALGGRSASMPMIASQVNRYPFFR